MKHEKYHVLVLQGGPDREAVVSRKSAASVAAAIKAAGHQATLKEIHPDDLSALDLQVDAIFPVLHGPWGEGGPLQSILEKNGVPFVGCDSKTAATAMDKSATKTIAREHGVITAPWSVIRKGDPCEVAFPLVVKPLRDGSSFGVHFCDNEAELKIATDELFEQFDELIVEKKLIGREMTVGIVHDTVLKALQIIPKSDFYDFDAKYDRDDTVYSFETGLNPSQLKALESDALKLYKALNCRDLTRIDFIVTEEGSHILLEANTMPGFTDHSLLPKAAADCGLPMPKLCDLLIRLALSR